MKQADSVIINSKVPKQLQGHEFKKGQSGNPAGRPEGPIISIVGELKKMFAEDPKMFHTYVTNLRKDKYMRRHIMEQVDGKPTERIEMSGKDGGTINITLFRDGK